MPAAVLPFVIEESITGGRRVDLTGSDRPQGKPREKPLFSSGGPVEHQEVYLPGRKLPIYQMQQGRQRPLVITGAFRDHQFVKDGGPVGTMHARAMRDSIEEIKDRMNPLRLTWGGETRTGVLTETNFGEESDHQITYELTFKIARGPTTRTPDAQRATSTSQQDASDVIAQMREQLAARRSQVAALRQQQLTIARAAEMENSIDAADTAFATAQSNAIVLEASAVAVTPAATTRAIAAMQVAQQACTATKVVVLAVPPSQAFTRPTSDGVSAYWQAQYGTASDLDVAAGQLQQLATAARARVTQAVRVYVVRPGDTLESIARQTLGDASRGGDLGVRADQLAPGLVIRIPQAT